MPSLKLIGYCALGLLVAALGLSLQIERRHAGKLQTQVIGLQAELKRISTAKDEQAKATAGNIAKANERIVYVDRVARGVETAPLPGDCKTPAAILESPDL